MVSRALGEDRDARASAFSMFRPSVVRAVLHEVGEELVADLQRLLKRSYAPIDERRGPKISRFSRTNSASACRPAIAPSRAWLDQEPLHDEELLLREGNSPLLLSDPASEHVCNRSAVRRSRCGARLEQCNPSRCPRAPSRAGRWQASPARTESDA